MALMVLAENLAITTVTELSLHANEICGVWEERVGGELAMRGTYTSAGIELIARSVTAAEVPLTLHKGKLRVAQGNFLRLADENLLSSSLAANTERPRAVTIQASAETSFGRGERRAAGEAASSAKKTGASFMNKGGASFMNKGGASFSNAGFNERSMSQDSFKAMARTGAGEITVSRARAQTLVSATSLHLSPRPPLGPMRPSADLPCDHLGQY